MYHGDLTRKAEQARRAAALEAKYPDALEPRPSPLMYRAAWAVFLLLTLINGIQTAGPDSLGIPAVVFRNRGGVLCRPGTHAVAGPAETARR